MFATSGRSRGRQVEEFGSEHELRKLVDKIFKVYNVDGTKVEKELNQDEFRAIVKDMGADVFGMAAFDEDSFQGTWKSIDTDGSNTLDKEEVLIFFKEMELRVLMAASAVAHEKKDDEEEQLERELKKMVIDVFKKYDTNGDKRLDQDELREFWKDLTGDQYDENDFQTTWLEIDTDGDGELKKGEVLRYFKSMEEKRRRHQEELAQAEERASQSEVPGPKPPPRPPPRRARPPPARRPPGGPPPKAQVCQGKGTRYDKSKDVSLIRQLVIFMAQPAHLIYVSKLCDAPFRSTLHKPSVEKLDDLFMSKRSTLTLEQVPPMLKDQIPNLLKQYVNDTCYLFGADEEVDNACAQICQAIIVGGQSFGTFHSMTIAFPPLERVQPAFDAL